MKILIIIILFICCSSVDHSNKSSNFIVEDNPSSSLLDTFKMSIIERYQPLDSFHRETTDSNSFAYYLQHLKLKKYGEKVKYFDGNLKTNYNVYSSVVDMKISNKDLQQCADAVMRLRAEYLYKQKKYNQISFLFIGDMKFHSYLDYTKTDRTYARFLNYLDYVFSYANTASLHKQLRPIRISQMQIGDVLVKKGNPFGHAVIVVDMCINGKGDKCFMLAQSYMPAQETQILLNPKNNTVWYKLPLDGEIQTPEWAFTVSDLRSW
jgi:hypothetical protein